MEGIKIIIFALVALIWLVIWIIRIFNKAFNQPTATNQKQKPVANKPPTSLEELLRQHLPKTEEEIRERTEPRRTQPLEKEIRERVEPGKVQPMKVEKLEKRSLESDKPKYKSLEVLEPRRRSLEKLEPLGSSQDRPLSETIEQRDDIVRRRREKNIYQASDKKAVSVYAKMLRNPAGARQAIVLAEILKPKF